MPVQVRLLGSVELSGRSGPTDAGPAKRRAVLTGLALEANRPMPLRRLAEMVWAGPPPRSAVANLRSHVTALRRTLGDRLVARPGAYQLDLAPDELDVASFRRLADAGRNAPPRELPPDLVVLVGRHAELDAVLAAIPPTPTATVPAGDRRPAPVASGPSVVVVHGPGGSGRSTLVVRAAHRIAAGFPDGQIFIELAGRSPAGPADLLGRVLRALGVPAAEVPEHVEERIGRYRSLLASRRVLVVVDGVEEMNQLRPLIPVRPGSALMATADRPIGTLDGLPHVGLGPLTPAQGWALLAAYVGVEPLATDPAATAKLIRRCVGLPRALRAAAGQLAARPQLSVRALLDGLDQDPATAAAERRARRTRHAA